MSRLTDSGTGRRPVLGGRGFNPSLPFPQSAPRTSPALRTDLDVAVAVRDVGERVGGEREALAGHLFAPVRRYAHVVVTLGVRRSPGQPHPGVYFQLGVAGGPRPGVLRVDAPGQPV